VRLDQHRGTVGSVQVMVREAPDRGRASRRPVVRPGLLDGVGAEQVVTGVPAGLVLADQVRPGQLGQQPPRVVRPGRGQADGGGQ
jgi:hypothetical protein